MATAKDLTWGGIAVRFLAALLLVYLTFNPTGFSWFHWTIKPMIDTPTAALSTLNPLKVLAGIALAACWWFFLQASQRSLTRTCQRAARLVRPRTGPRTPGRWDGRRGRGPA